MKKRNLVIAQRKMMKPERAIASLVENLKKLMQKGMNIPPPPIPATVDIDIVTIRIAKPMNSIPIIGKIGL